MSLSIGPGGRAARAHGRHALMPLHARTVFVHDPSDDSHAAFDTEPA